MESTKESSQTSILRDAIGDRILACPSCKMPFIADPKDDSLICGRCGAGYEIVEGIPIFAPLEDLPSHQRIESEFHSLIADEACNVHCLSSYRSENLHDAILAPIVKDSQITSRVLEIGSGPGYDLIRMCSDRRQVYGVDVSLGMCIEAYKRVARVCTTHVPLVVQADGEALPFSDTSFDSAYCIGSLHHFANEDAVLREVWRVLKPGALFSIGSEPNRLPYRFKRIKRSRMARALLRAIRDDYTIDGGSIGDFQTSGYEETDFARMATANHFTVLNVTPAWYLNGFISLLGLDPPTAVGRLMVKVDSCLASCDIFRRLSWKWNVLMKKEGDSF